jgi:uncharacterized protein DUF4124
MIRATLAAVLVLAVVPPFAHADVYTWTDAKGVLNVSNLTPPEGVQVEKTVHEVAPASVPAPSPYPPPPMIDPAAQAEVQFLAQKVRQLEFEVELARRRQCNTWWTQDRRRPITDAIPRGSAAAAGVLADIRRVS